MPSDRDERPSCCPSEYGTGAPPALEQARVPGRALHMGSRVSGGGDKQRLANVAFEPLLLLLS